MPELPEVETIARTLKPILVGTTILDSKIYWARTIAEPSARKFKETIRGAQILGVGRRAKYLNLQLGIPPKGDAYNLLIHLRMSGDFFVRECTIKPEKHDRLLLILSNDRQLVFNDTRKFGRVWLTNAPETILGKLGPEPFSDEFTEKWLYENLRSRRRQMKPLLLDQAFLAGLGNIYTDECLHLSKIHPMKLSDTIKFGQAEALHHAIRAVLTEGIRRNGASIDWVYRGGEYQNYFRVYDRAGKPCPVCGRKIQRIVVSQRGTHICPNCQKLR